MLQRVITAAGFAVIWLLGIAFQGLLLRTLILISMLIAINEMYRALRAANHDPIRWSGYLFCFCTFAFQIMKADLGVPLFQHLDPTLAALMLCTLIVTAFVVLKGRLIFDDLESALFPMLYPGVFFSLMMTMQDLGNRYTAACILLLMFFTASVNDVFAMLIGLRFGKHRLSPTISPKKSVEGSIAGLIAGTLFSVLVPFLFALLAKVLPDSVTQGFELPALWKFAVLGLVASWLSQIGDLTASLVKRHCGIKDFGTIFPGHGGMMDRMDGILYCAVACWFFFHLAGIH